MGGKGGRPRLYPIHWLKIGEAMMIPWQVYGGLDVRPKNLNKLNAAIRQEEKRYGKRFLRQKRPAALKVTRTF